jgi:hypothetical protein
LTVAVITAVFLLIDFVISTAKIVVDLVTTNDSLWWPLLLLTNTLPVSRVHHRINKNIDVAPQH